MFIRTFSGDPILIDLSTLTLLVYRKESCLLPYIDYIFDQSLRFGKEFHGLAN